MLETAVQKKFADAVDRLMGQVKRDRSILAALLCGSLAHDVVWDKSDIDLILITIDDKSFTKEDSSIAIYADDLNVHACLMPRAQFVRIVDGSLGNSFFHSLLAKGRLLYTHDPSIATLCDRLADIGERDARLQLLCAGTAALPSMYKARKWFVTRGDLDYTALWILYASTPLAQIEVIGRRLLADREVIPQAMTLNPSFFKIVYTDMLNSRKSAKSVNAALDAMDAYIADRIPLLFEPILEHLRDVGEARSATEIETYFDRNFGVSGVTTACEYLADRGLIGKASTPAKLTKRSNCEVQELAFVYLGEPPDEF